ncbi:hypothetical protein BDV38DRAFT_272602 [Aspergillus pseudotamarii]|uniref:Uncharacterized protein n=1 Tax=Aspergillus pseudotamarii TaxID=132259 RepID=A0A5N6SPJ4_ASPPS|nr:uncharacterized protein BDV38DRAFT_272602 [Aspergillus pseudotamarii]KAE8135779.1 hypothetical protein BDV38DRAFT_272602 [Aspergillus pseudotamarii]
MWKSRARQPATNIVTVSRRLPRSTRPAAITWRRGYASHGPHASEQPGSSSRWLKTSLGLAGTGAAAFLVYTYATFDKNQAGSQADLKTHDLSRATEKLDSQYVQHKRSLKSPGVYVWGTNSSRVVDPNSKETVIKAPRRFRFFDGQVLRDLKLSDKSGAAISENGDLIQWGKGYSESDFKPTKTLTGKNLTSLCMSNNRILALSSDGSVYSLPIAKDDQQSGRKPKESSWVPFWSGKSGLGEKITMLRGGLEHALLLTNHGRVFSVASSTESYPSFGQLGVPGLTWATRPKGPVDMCHEIEAFRGTRITQIATGDYHSLALSKDGNLFTFGDNSFGQLGMAFDATLPFSDTPTSVPIKKLYKGNIWFAKVTGIAAGGANSFFTVDAQRIVGPGEDPSTIRDLDRITADTWTCGRGIWGALGNGKWTHMQDAPTKVKSLSGLFEYDERRKKLTPIRLRDLSVGTTHVSAVMNNDAHIDSSPSKSLNDATNFGFDVLFWGGNEHFQLGTSRRSNQSKPTHINAPPEDKGELAEQEARLQVMPRHKGKVGSRTVNMEQRNQKRGRRAAEKAEKDAAKRKREEAPEDSLSKRLKPSTDEANEINQGADYIPFDENYSENYDGNYDENQIDAPAGDMPFYGLLDPEEQEYFSRANEVLELNQFQDAEERRIFVDSVYREADGKELKIACSQGCSRLMEKLISMSDMRQIHRLFNKFIGHFLNLVQHRFASHCCETLFVNAAPGITQKASKSKSDKMDIDEEGEELEPELSLAEMFIKVVEELEGNWGYLLTERFASHTIRVLLLVLAGEPVDVSANDSVIASRKKEKLGLLQGETQDGDAPAQKRNVPDAFEATLKKIMKDMVSVLDDTYLRALATHPVGNPVLQVLVFLELSHFGKSSAKDPNSITRRLIPDESFEEGSETTTFVRGLLYDPVGSRLLETIVRCMPGKAFKGLYKNFIRDQITSFARNITAGYVVLRVLERLGKDDLQQALERIVPQVPSLLERSRMVVPKVLIERCLVRGVDTAPLARALEESYDKDPARRLEQILRLESTTQEEPEESEQKPKAANIAPSQSLTGEKLHGSLLAQTMLTAPGPISGLIYSSLLAQSSESLVKIAKDPTASRVIQQALTVPTSTTQFRRQFAPRFTSHLKELALDSSGSHVVDALWPATKDIFFIKERMAQELTQHEMALRDSFVGRAVWRNWAMDLYKRRRGEWAVKAKGIDNNNSTGERPKSRIELARANAVEDLLIPFIRSADEDPLGQKALENGVNGTNGSHNNVKLSGTSLVDHKKPDELQSILQLELPEQGTGQDGLVEALQKVLRYSVNTWHQGFLDKLYASTNAPGVASELILAALNTNVHVYQVSPALTVIEKFTGKQLASLFGLNGLRAGGISVQGGSASNTTSIVIARNNLFPATKRDGNGDYRFVLFTSAHGHYSIEKAAQMLGLGSSSVWSVPIDKQGRMIPAELENLVRKALTENRTPFYVNATAGTTVMGSFDPFDEIAAICKKYNLWFHVDGSWGGSFVFSKRHRQKLAGAEKADSIAINPHKMLGVPVTCSFLLAADLRRFHRANTLPAGYLFHNEDTELPEASGCNGTVESELGVDSPEVWDLADLTLQCGRRADSLKLFLGWTYYGTAGYEKQIDTACDIAAHLATLVAENPNFILVSENPPPCLQVCFYYAPGGQFLHPRGIVSNEAERGKANSKVTEQVTHAIVSKGFMVDFAPPSGDEDAVGNGKFFRCVVNVQTTKETVEALLRAIEEVGPGIIENMKVQNAPRNFNRPGERGHGPVVHHP